VWDDAILKDDWYVPDASAHPFSIKAGAQNGYSTSFNENEIVIRGVVGTTAVSGKLVNVLSVLRFGYVFHDTAEVHLATQAETLQVWLDRFIKIKEVR
jgi:hypothetical protein